MNPVKKKTMTFCGPQFQKAWRIEIAEKLRCLGFPGKSEKNASKELLKKRREEMKHVAEVRAHYDIKMACVNQLVLELTKIKLQLEEKDRELTRRERLLSMTLSSSGSPTARAMGRMSKKNNWRFGLKRRSAQDSSVGTPVDLVSRSSTLPARLEKPHITIGGQRNNKRVPVYLEVEDPSKSLFNLIKRPFQSNSNIPTISELTQHSTTRSRMDVTEARLSFSDTDTDRSSTDIDDENANDIDMVGMDKNGNSRDSLDDLNKTVQELGKWERVRGRASGSSKNGSGRYRENYITATRYSGRYCTIDLAQYSRTSNIDCLSQEDTMSRSLTNDVQVPGGAKEDVPRNGSSQEGFSSSNWETCSEEDLTAPTPIVPVTLRRESVSRHPVQRLKRPSSTISSQSLPIGIPEPITDVTVQLQDVTITECIL